MAFLDRLSADARSCLLEISRLQQMEQGDYIIRRGDTCGDIYLIEEGALEVVDPRSTPEVVLFVFNVGSVVGEMSFVAPAPRDADVRVARTGRMRVLDREALEQLLDARPKVASDFYKTISEILVERLRVSNTNSSLSTVASGRGDATDSFAEEARRIAEAARNTWFETDALLRRNPDDQDAARRVRAAFERIVQDTGDWLSEFTSAEQRWQAGEALARELHPYIVTSNLAKHTLNPDSGHSGDPLMMAHLLIGRPAGDGELGRLLDELLLGLPTCTGIRRRVTWAAEAVTSALPEGRRTRIMLINASCGDLNAKLILDLSRRGADVTVLDGSREALATFDSGLGARPRSVEYRLVCQDIAELLMYPGRFDYGEFDFVVVDGIVEYLPDRLVAALCAITRAHLAADGVAVFTAIGPSSDALFLDHVLRWSTTRRTPAALVALIESAGLAARLIPDDAPDQGAAIVVGGRLPATDSRPAG